MRITDLLDIRSIALDAAPKSKQETLDAAVALMVKSGRSQTKMRTAHRFTQEKKRAPQESERELRFRTENVMQ